MYRMIRSFRDLVAFRIGFYKFLIITFIGMFIGFFAPSVHELLDPQFYSNADPFLKTAYRIFCSLLVLAISIFLAFRQIHSAPSEGKYGVQKDLPHPRYSQEDLDLEGWEFQQFGEFQYIYSRVLNESLCNANSFLVPHSPAPYQIHDRALPYRTIIISKNEQKRNQWGQSNLIFYLGPSGAFSPPYWSVKLLCLWRSPIVR